MNTALKRTIAKETRLRLTALPPSVNRIYRYSKGKVYKIQRVQSWLNSVGHLINRQMEGQPKWDEPVEVSVTMLRPRSNADLDNRLKCIGDMLEDFRIIQNDKQIMKWTAEWSLRPVADYPCLISIRKWEK